MAKASFDKLPAEVYHAVADFLLEECGRHESLRPWLSLRLICPAFTSVITQRIAGHLACGDLKLDTTTAYCARNVRCVLSLMKWRDVQCTAWRVSLITEGYWWTATSRRQVKDCTALLHAVRATVQVLTFSSYTYYSTGYRLPKTRILPSLSSSFPELRHLIISDSTLSLLPALLSNSPKLEKLTFGVSWLVIQDHLQVFPQLPTAFSSIGRGGLVLERLMLILHDNEDDDKIMGFIDSWNMPVEHLDLFISTLNESYSWDRLATLIQTSRIAISCSVMTIICRGVEVGKRALPEKLGKEDHRIHWDSFLDDLDARYAGLRAMLL